MKLNTIINGDCLEELKKLEDNFVDLIFVDPPYNMQLKNNLYRTNGTKVDGVNDKWDKFSSFKEYDNFCISWLFECKRILKDTGTIWVIGSYHNIFRIGYLMQNLGYWILNNVTWLKTNPMPNFLGTRFTNATETLLWCSKGENYKKYKFNYELMKKYNNNKQMSSVWKIGLCIGNERIKGNDGKKIHSTQKPEELLKRIILSTTKENDIILDPFFGTGTTGAVAKKLKRNFIGIEKEEKYIKVANERINNINFYFEEINWKEESNKEKQIKIPFELLLKNKYLNIGDILYSRKRFNKKAIILENGNLKCENNIGSIHKIGALIQNSISCNGQRFWYLFRNNKAILLDEVRNKYIKENIS